MTECSACGDCCDPVHVKRMTFLLMLRPIDPNHNFVVEHWVPNASLASDEWIRVDCPFFDRDSRLCIAHDKRPPICSGYPFYGQEPSEHIRRGSGFMFERCSYREDVPVELRSRLTTKEQWKSD